MIKTAKYFLMCALSLGVLVAAAPSVAAQQPKKTETTDTQQTCEDKTFLLFPAWYNGLTTGENCSDIKSPSDASVGGVSNFIWIITFNAVTMLLVAAGYAAVAFIIYGGYKYMISAGSSDGMVAARKTIMNACIGLAISIAAVAIVRTFSNQFGL